MKVLQVLIKKEIFEKGVYSPETRKAFWQWPSLYFSSGLRIEGNELLIPSGSYQATKPYNLLIFGEQLSLSNPEQQQIEQPIASNSFEDFRLTSDKEKVQVYTSFSDWRFSEVPKADNHKIGELKPGESLRFMANDRYDYSASMRRQRSYILYDYLFHYMGQAKKIRYTDQIKPKEVMINDWKEVDERKIIK